MVLNFIRILLLCLLIVRPDSAHTFFGDDAPKAFDSLVEMADAMAREIKTDYPGKMLYLDREDIRNDLDGSTSPFSSHLANELERALSRNAFGFEKRDLDKADYGLSANYRQTGDKVTVYLQLKELKRGSTYRNLKGNYAISRDRLPPDSFADSLDSRVSRLALKVARGWLRAGQLTVFVTPVIEARKKYSSPFSEYVTRKIKTILPSEQSLKVIEEKPAMQKLASTRSITVSKPLSAAGDAAMVGADAVLEGSYLRGKDSVSLTITLKNLKGEVLANAEELVPIELINYSIENDAAETLAQIADTEHETGGDTVTISSNKGGAYQVFSEGEIVSFRLQVKRPLFLYVYDINPKGEVNQLYPKAGETEIPKMPGLIHMLPEENDSWVIKVEPPFGTDAVKVFASNRKLPLPRINTQTPSRSFDGNTRSLKRVDQVQKELAAQPAINSKDLVDYYKGIARKTGSTLFESTVYIETRGKIAD